MRDVFQRLGIGIVVTCLTLVVGIGPAAADDLTTFLPEAEAVFIQKTTAFPGIGDTLLMVSLSDEQIEVLANETGRTDFVVLGKDENLTILRDDGRGGDQAAGDGLFTGVANVDEVALDERAEADRSNFSAAESEGVTVPLFEGRVAAGTENAVPFDAEGFADGKKVQLTKPVETIGPEASEPVSEPVSVSKSAPGSPVSKMVTPGINPFQARSLMITDLSVVKDPTRTFDACTGTGTPGGVWTFEHLMTEMANQAATGIAPAAFVEDWLNHWTVPQTINNDSVATRAAMAGLISEWRFQSGGGALNLTIAPFRLLAIVARADLATTRGGGSGYGTRTGDFLDAGEARFVFGLVLPPGWSDPGFSFPVPIDGGPCMAQRMTVIFEYRVPKCKCKQVRSWARQWVKLSTLAFPSPAYNQALENITEQFVPAASNPIKPNGSALGQLRTNEIALEAPNWELREFQLTQAPFTFLHETTTADNPEDSHNNNAGFLNWVMGPVFAAINAGGIGAPIPPVPLLFTGAPPPPGHFLGAHATVPSPAFFWDHPSIPFTPNTVESRFRASIASCGGCHARETLTPFVHVEPATPSGPAILSVFLTGVNGVQDPGFPSPPNPPTTRDFDDLARRELDLKRKARMFCFRLHPVSLVAVRGALAFAKAGALPDDLFEGQEPLPEEDQVSLAADMLDAPAISEVH